MLELLFISIKFTFRFTIIYLDREIEQNFRFTRSRINLTCTC